MTEVLHLAPPTDTETSELFNQQVNQAAAAWTEDLLVLDNGTVFALAGNANNPDLQKRIVDVKGGNRKVVQPVGWTTFFDERVLSTIDVDAIKLSSLQELVRNPDELTARLGALTFLRATADLNAKKELGIHASIIPEAGENGNPPEVQIYSPDGMTITTAITRAAITQGAETVMTSANRSDEPESVTTTTALAFIDGTLPENGPPKVLVNSCKDEDRPSRPRGSYPVLKIAQGGEEFINIRPGCFEPTILEAALHGFPVRMAPNPQKVKYPDSILRMQDLPTDVQSLKGPEFRLGLLAHLGWSNSLEA